MKLSNYIIGLLILGSSLLGQQEKSAIELHISANVLDQIEVITISDIDAGIVLPGQEEKVISPITDGGAGVLRLEGQANSSIQVSYSIQVTMTNLDTNQPLLMNYMLSGSPENNQSASILFTTNPENVVLNSAGVYYMWVGCRFSLVGLVPGQYDGDFIVEVDYN
ncbi:MAG: hypothetical protein HOB84_11150 [Candidatus Marinimicrobia bacterium]|jgi:hypothetical protein|nr:hypothetical protein [Candidatus Neomarinimicrobiota bacterium]MBT4360858.1 hypothetical protein [Candidatus Neomarinimicrobiota bacterium]MBT4715320.1 hypothetical protein [Candidatus Neomarinimicrobiota bacterium]MBT4946982.1 hypothetical protein [Candidatus Neomarinimicrobiota bacterium]MBT5268389.1 hypothetical protein [Candidatus Neomarinimicrobiota bacterium]